LTTTQESGGPTKLCGLL